MLDGDDGNGPVRERGAPGGRGDVLGQGADLRVLPEVGPAEDDAAVRRGGLEGHPGRRSGVEALSFKCIFSGKRLLVRVHDALSS